MTIGLFPLSAELYPLCKEFILTREYCGVALAAAFRDAGKPDRHGWQNTSFAVVATTNGNRMAQINGVLHVTPGRTLLHLLDSAACGDPCREQIAPWLSNRDLFSIIGTAEGTRFLESIVSLPCDRAVDYELMTLGQEPPGSTARLPNLDEPASRRKFEPYIRRIHPGDAEILLPLQLGYEQEEVLAPGKTPNRDQCLLSFRSALARQDVYAAFYGTTPVAKAGTNARGYHWDQLGGIYTVPEFRSKGIASALVAHVVRRRLKDGKNAVLFVKTGNLSAKSAYRKVGFSRKNDFRIVYY